MVEKVEKMQRENVSGKVERVNEVRNEVKVERRKVNRGLGETKWSKKVVSENG